MSSGQQRLWFLDQVIQDTPAYADTYALRFDGMLDVAMLERAFAEIVRRHEVLRTALRIIGGTPQQVVLEHLPVVLSHTSLEAAPPDGRESLVQRLALHANSQPFDLGSPPLWRLNLVRLAADQHVLLLTIHHTISDGWSQPVLYRELAAAYSAFCQGLPSPLRDLPVQFADFAIWEQNLLKTGAFDEQVAAWMRTLAGPLPDVRSPADRPRPPRQTFVGTGQMWHFPDPLAATMATLAAREGVETWHVLLAALQALMFCETGEGDVLLGHSAPNRPRPEMAGLIGMIVNAVPLRGQVLGNPTFRELVGRAGGMCREAIKNQQPPLNQLLSELKLPRTPGANPLFQVFVLQDFLPPPARLPGGTLQPWILESSVSRFDLEMWIAQEEPDAAVHSADRPARCLGVHLQFNVELFSPAAITRIRNGLQRLVTEGVADPETRLETLRDALVTAARSERSDRRQASAQVLKSARRKAVEA